MEEALEDEDDEEEYSSEDVADDDDDDEEEMDAAGVSEAVKGADGDTAGIGSPRPGLKAEMQMRRGEARRDAQKPAVEGKLRNT